MESFPGPSADDLEAVQDALEVARTQWLRGERQEALRWLRRAIDAAFDQGDDRRGLSLSKTASELQSSIGSTPPLPTQRLVAPVEVRPSLAPPPPRARAASVMPPELPRRTAPPPSPSIPPPGRIPMPTPSAGAALGSAPPRPLRGPVRAVEVSPPSMPPSTSSVLRGPVRLPLPPSGPTPGNSVRPMPEATVTPPRVAPTEAPGGRRNTRANRRNTRAHPGEASRPTTRQPRVEAAASSMRGETDLPTLQGERSPLVDGDTSVIPMPDVAALAEAFAARAVGERTAPYVPAAVPVLTQSVRVAVGPGPTLRLLPASEGLRAGEFEAWLTATSPAVDLATALRTKRG